MKVLLISNYKKGTGGISGQVELLHSNLCKEGIESDIFNTKGSIGYRLRCFKVLRERAIEYDVLHIHCCSGFGGFFPAIVGITVGKRLSKRVVVTYHGGGADNFFNKHQLLVKHFLSWTDTNIVLSGFLGSVFDKYNIPYTVVPNVIELDSSRFRKRNVISPDFISIRTLSPLYNIECIIKAFEIVKGRIPTATLTIVGDGPSKKSLMEMVQERQIKDVTFTGRVDNSAIYQYLDKADIMLSSPRIDNMPVSILEGMNAGLLVISSNVGGVPYMIEEGKNGLLFDSNDYYQLAEQMDWAINNYKLVSEMMESARINLNYYSWANVWPKLSHIYGN